MTWYEQVQEFARKANTAQNQLDPERWPLIPESPTQLSDTAMNFIKKMLLDEIEEFEEATTIYEQADALLDMIYYILDTCAKHSLTIKHGFDRMHDTLPFLFKHEEAAAVARMIRVNVDKLGEKEHRLSLEMTAIIIHRFADAHGMDLDPLFDLVQEANMAKFPEGVVTLDTDPESSRYGKVLKPEGWVAPDLKIKEALESQKMIFKYESDQDLDAWLQEQQEKAAKDEV